MLSIGKIGNSRGQQLYYEQQVAGGREDYYAGKGEAPGRWAGRGSGTLGLVGELDAVQLAAMFDGRHPVTGEQLAIRGERSTTAGIDMTFSAPKSVSVLFAVGDEELAYALVDAHEAAVAAALGYMQQYACRVRRGSARHGTIRSERAESGFVAAAYRHRMSRAQDPQLHTHMVAANMAMGADGRWTALDAKHIYAHAKAGGAVYQAHLRAAVRERLPWAEWGQVREGMAELEQVPAGVREEFSTRRQRILEREAELVDAGTQVGDAGRGRIALDTREAKRDVEEDDWRTAIRARAAEHGLGQAQLDELAQLLEAPEQAPLSDEVLAHQLFGPAGLTATSNTFRERDVVIAVAAAHRQGLAAGEVLHTVGRMLSDPRVVAIPGTDAEPSYTTRELLQAEQGIVQHACDGRGRRAGILDAERVERTLAQLPQPLTGEQAAVVTAIATSGNRIDTVEALAGTGKTTSATALRELYERQGYRVLGAAPTGRAVRELVERAGILESRTLDAWALKLAADPTGLRLAEVTEAGQVRRVPAVMVIDEAGMAHTRVSAGVIDAAMDARVKVVAVGDSGQLASVQAGGWLGALTRRNGSHELVEVMRQRDPLERRGLARLHRGNPDEYLTLKARRLELEVFGGEQPGVDGERAAIERWAAAREQHGPEEAVLICRDNQRRDRLNQAARGLLQERGELGDVVEIAGVQWAVGDRVIARRNDRGRDLDNGMRATVISVAEDRGLTVRIDAGEHRQLDVDYVSEHVEHAYALTGHGMQGGTVQWAGVIGQAEDFTRNWSYTALSRARHPTQILIIDAPTEAQQAREEIAPAGPAREQTPLQRLAVRMRERDDEDLALEALEHAQLAEPASTPQESPAALDSSEPNLGVDIDAVPDVEGLTLRASATAQPVAESVSGTTLAELATVRQQLAELRDRLQDPAVQTARDIAATRETIAAIGAEADRDRKPAGWRDRGPHQVRARARGRQLHELAERERRLLADVPDPEAVLEQADRDRERQGQLIGVDGELNRRAVAEELASDPPWLQATLGPEPELEHHRTRWRRTARELASNRIDRQIADPADPGVRPGDHALARSISDTRAALGLDLPAAGHDQGIN